MKPITLIFVFLCCFLSASALAQIGIGTTQPQEKLHVEGTLRVEGFDDGNDTTALVGADVDGTLTALNIDNNLTIINNTLELTRSYLFEIGHFDMSTVTIVSGEVADLELDIEDGYVNDGKTIIYLDNLAANIRLTGIEDGEDGMHLFLYNTNPRTIQILDESSAGNNSELENRIKVLMTNETITGNGCMELLYDGNSERWLLLSIHD